MRRDNLGRFIKNRIKLNCDWCKKQIEIPPSQLRANRHYCNVNCRVEHVKSGSHWAYGLTKETHEGIRTTSKKLMGHKSFRKPSEGHTRKDGRVQFSVNNKNKYEHRIVMEKHLGRKLETHETIHHIDGNPTNNKIKNLKLLNSQSEHLKIHHKQGHFKEHLEKLHKINKLRGADGRW